MRFNSSVWHAFLVLCPFGVGMFVYIIVRLWRFKGWHHFFDPKHNADQRLRDEGGDFSTHWSHYEGLAKLAITLSAGAVAFLINTIANEKPSLNSGSASPALPQSSWASLELQSSC